MGFRAPTTVTIAFDEGDFAGAEFVGTLSMSIEKVLELQELAGDSNSQDLLMQRFAEEGLLGWNLEDEDGSPLDVNVENFLAQALALRMAVVLHWLEKVGDLPTPLGSKRPASASNGTSAEDLPKLDSIPMSSI